MAILTDSHAAIHRQNKKYHAVTYAKIFQRVLPRAGNHTHSSVRLQQGDDQATSPD